jgi:hypothetical protein
MWLLGLVPVYLGFAVAVGRVCRLNGQIEERLTASALAGRADAPPAPSLRTPATPAQPVSRRGALTDARVEEGASGPEKEAVETR